MASDQTPRDQAQCFDCGFEASGGSDEWEVADHPPIGTVTRCPECGSTDVHTQA